jgi:hypothetical protein
MESTSHLTVLSYGGGVNSSALLWGLHERGELPNAVLFADTGGEHQHVYETVERVREFCEREGVLFEVVTNADPSGERHGHQSLEDECLRNETLPSLAYGFKGCSAKWKRQPMDRWVKAWPEARSAWERGELVTRLLGIDADEAHRSANLTEDKLFRYERPLIDWGWGREECLEAVDRSPFGPVGKSACWFCPAMKKKEVLDLERQHPDLFARAVAMEHGAEGGNNVVKGLGRNWSWEGLVKADKAQLRLFPESVDEACGCYDGSDE